MKHVLALIPAIALASVAVAVQARQTTPSAADSALLAEVRAIRAELRDAASNSMRTQLLIARLSLQEQRVASLSRELGEVQTNLTKASDERAQWERQLRALNDALADVTLSDEKRTDFTAEREAVRKRLEQARQTEQGVRVHESEVMGVITSEQARWTEFNSRLDELERALSTSKR